MSRYVFPLFWGSLMLSSSAFGADPLSMGLDSLGIRFSDGTVQTTAALPPLPANMAWVAHNGGHYTSPVDAMNQLRDWCHADSILAPDYSRCTLLIAPGVYELGSNQLVMQAGVNIVGMGVKTTVISGEVDDPAQGVGSALIRGAQRTALRDLTVVNTGTFVASAGIYNMEPAFIIERVEVIVDGKASFNTGIINEGAESNYTDIRVSVVGLANASCNGIENKGMGSIEINRARVSVSGCTDNTAIANSYAVNLRLVDVTASAIAIGTQKASGVWSSGSGLTIQDSRLEGRTYSLGIGSTSAKIINTQLDGPVGADSAGLQCWGTYDNNLAIKPC
ncbi:MAG TPA: hypothetical protein EYP34_03250 [Chromatiaceae bacterium]|nr:hypothetical protein [Chromatiaceae bacterium]